MKDLFDKTDIAIDLTSLLDVIFIVLLIVMCNQTFASNSAKETSSDANNVKTAYENHSEKYEETNEYVLFVDVTSTYNPDALSERKLSVLSGINSEDKNTKNGLYSFDINTDNEKDQYVLLEDYLREKINEYNPMDVSTKRPIILTLNKGDDDILYRDEQAIESVFESLQNEYENIYIR